MALKLAGKKQIVKDVASGVKDALSLVVADYRGLTSTQMTDLRAQARQSGVNIRIVRNTLAKRAVEGSKFECVNEVLTGPVLLAFSETSPGSAARLLRKFAKDNNKLEVKGLSIGDKLLPVSALDSVADLPTKEEAISMLLSVMQAPIVKFARTMAEPHAKLVRTFAALRDAKQSAQ